MKYKDFLHIGDDVDFVSVNLKHVVMVQLRDGVFRVKTVTGDVVQCSHSAENAHDMYRGFVNQLVGENKEPIRASKGSIGFDPRIPG